ncbi:acyl-CoA dehydrogenase family protein [Tsukamurella soli]|uniref:acyl-CoA dehydrogenase family protein n=1 Tax=Tsukamurella soli TaxID=644556 RepID=UPI00360F6DB5
MDFTASEASIDLAALTRRLLQAWADSGPAIHTVAGVRPGFDVALWSRLASAGVLDAALPQQVGGGGFGLEEQCAILGEIGRTTAPAPYLASIAVGAATVGRFGTPAQIERWAVPVVRGSATVAPALAEPGPGTVVAGRTPAGLRLDGARTAVPSGAFADTVLVEASTPDGPVLALLDRGARGLTIARQEVVDGDDAALLEFDGVEVPTDGVLDGAEAAAWARRRATIGWCAWQLGVLDAALHATAEYARTREQFGKPIGSFQAVRQRLADAYIDVDAVRLTLTEAVWRETAGLPSGEAVATAKFWAAEAGHRVAHTAVHVHGGVGIDTDHPTHRYFVAAKRAEFALGSATAQLRTLGRLLAGA